MRGRTYRGASLGIERMNRIIQLSREHGPLSVKFVSYELDLNEKSAVGYLHRLTDMRVMQLLERERGNAPKFYQVLPGAALMPVPVPVFGKRASRARDGAVRGRPKPKHPSEEDRMQRRVVWEPAAQVGMQRDGLVAALFGDWKAA